MNFSALPASPTAESGRCRCGRAAAFAVAIAVAACASPRGPAELHFGMLDAPEGSLIHFPPAPEVPRYLYAGQLTGNRNFRRAGDEVQSAADRLFRWIVGLNGMFERERVLQRPVTGMVDDDGRILVTDASRQAVMVFDAQVGELGEWQRAHATANFVSPVGIAAGPDGQVYVADAELGIVARLDRSGLPLGPIGRGLLKRPTGLARDQIRKLLYVADTQAHDVKVFDDDGRLVSVIGSRGERDGEFNYPTHVAVAQGALYVTDTMNNRVQVFSPEGAWRERKFGTPGLYLGNLVRPKGVAVDSEGHVYVVESYYDHLLVFNAAGEFLLPIGGTGKETGRFYLPAGVWVDNRNRVFVADMFNGRVMVFQFLGGG